MPGFLKLCILGSLAPIGCALGLIGNWPWLVAEASRRPLWTLWMTYLFEITALFWYIVYVFTWGSAGPTAEPAPQSGPAVATRAVVVSLALALGVSVTSIIYEIRTEDAGRARALPADARIDLLRRIPRSGEPVAWFLTCHIADAAGRTHPATLYLSRSEAQAAGLADPAPPTLRLLYDPERPARCWAAAFTGHVNRLYEMNGSVVFFGALLTMLLAKLQADYPTKPWPSWKTGPFLAIATVLFLSSVGKLILREW